VLPQEEQPQAQEAVVVEALVSPQEEEVVVAVEGVAEVLALLVEA
jgi:hypothetical protein